MPTPNLVQRGRTWFIRYVIPQDRWEDVGAAMRSSSGIRRDITRTLDTRDLAEARRRREPALEAIRREVDAALEAIGKRPLTDWTADWETRAVARREQLEAARKVVVFTEQGPDGSVAHWTAADDLDEELEADAEAVETTHGPAAARRFVAITKGAGLSVAQAQRQWLAVEKDRVKGNTVASHEAAFTKLGAYLKAREGWSSLQAVSLPEITRRIAGEFIHQRREQGAAAQTIQREASAFNGMWRWAVRRGYVELNPWADQTAGLKGGRLETQRARPGGRERAYTGAELETLLRAGQEDLAPNRGGYAATLWDVMRLLLLTGCRAGELMSLRVKDVIAGGAAIVVAGEGGKTEAASRIVPLHDLAQAVVRTRLATIPNGDPEASLWPEVPPTGRDKRRSKVIVTRFPPIRRKLLGPSDEVDLHSFRRSFITAAETAMHRGGRLNAELIALLVGHRRGGLALDLYSDWAKMGRRGELEGSLRERLGTLRATVDDAVGIGMEEGVRRALEETQGSRPAVVRVTPAFRRLDDLGVF